MEQEKLFNILENNIEINKLLRSMFQTLSIKAQDPKMKKLNELINKSEEIVDSMKDD